MGAYTRFFERRIERELAAEATRGISPPPGTVMGTARKGASVSDRRQLIPPLGLREYWYPMLPARRVPKKKPLYWRMLGDELSLFRDKDGNVVAVSDVCPHRGASLSRGSCFFHGTITCPYHGATFNAAGECKAFLPEGPDSKMPGNLSVRTYPTRTLRGYVFVWMGDGEPSQIEDDVPPELFDEDTTVFLTTYTYWRCNWMIAIENQNDSHNGFYAHRNSVMQLTARRGRARTPIGPRTKLMNDRALIPLMKNQNYYNDKDGGEPYQLYYPGINAHWPIGQWRRWLWALCSPWYKIVNGKWRIRKTYTSSEEWASTAGASTWHLPSAVRVNFGLFGYTRTAVPVTEGLSRMVYFHHRLRSKSFLGRLGQVLWYYGGFNWWLHYNFSGQDATVASPCRYWTEEYLAPTDSHLVLLRKLVTERSRDALRNKATAAATVAPPSEDALYSMQTQHGIAVENSLEEAEAITETVSARDSIMFGKPLSKS